MVEPDAHNCGKPKNPKAFRLLERLQTNPKVYYISEREWVRKAGDNYLEGEWEKVKNNHGNDHE